MIQSVPPLFSNSSLWISLKRQAPLIILVITMMTMLSACATRPPASNPEAQRIYDEMNDPFEPVNRAVFSFNRAVDGFLIEPAARIYRRYGPPEFRKVVTNVIRNWLAPLVFVNDILQGELDRAAVTLKRFATNTTVGLLGTMDPATGMGLQYHSEDFGQTLATWGIGEGPYIILPILGPSGLRDTTGTIVEFFYDPVGLYLDHKNWTYVSYTRTGLRGLAARERNLETMDELESSSVDFYATLRSAYRQNRRYEISNGDLQNSNEEEQLFEEEFE